MAELPPEERIRLARAMRGYSGLNLGPLAKATGIHPDTLRAFSGPKARRAPKPDELRALAEGVGIPVRFATEGFAPLVEPDTELAALAKQVDGLRALLRVLLSPGSRQPGDAGLPPLPRDLERRFRAARRILEGLEPGGNPWAEDPSQGAGA